jgi:hypothetical protein
MWWLCERSRKEDATHCDVTRVIYTFPNLNLNPPDPLLSQPTSHPGQIIFEFHLDETKPCVEKIPHPSLPSHPSVFSPAPVLPLPCHRRGCRPSTLYLPVLLQYPLSPPGEIGLLLPCIVFLVPTFPLHLVLSSIFLILVRPVSHDCFDDIRRSSPARTHWRWWCNLNSLVIGAVCLQPTDVDYVVYFHVVWQIQLHSIGIYKAHNLIGAQISVDKLPGAGPHVRIRYG